MPRPNKEKCISELALEGLVSIDDFKISVDEWNEIAVEIFNSTIAELKISDFEWIKRYNACKSIYDTDLALNRKTTHGSYVYFLINKLTGGVFYIGKGYGNRVFGHDNDKTESNKVGVIKEIGAENVMHFIFKNNLTLGQSLSLEAYLINVIDGLTNIQTPKIDFDYLVYLRHNYYLNLCVNAGLIN